MALAQTATSRMCSWESPDDDLEGESIAGTRSPFWNQGTKNRSADVKQCLRRLKARRASDGSRRAAAAQIGELAEEADRDQANCATRLLLKLTKAGQSAENKVAAVRALNRLQKSKHHLHALSGRRLNKAIDRMVLILLTDTPHPDAQTWAAHLLRSIALRGRACRRTIGCHPTAPAALRGALCSGTEELQEAGARALREVCICREACGQVATPLVQEALRELLGSQSSRVSAAAAWAICTVACTPQQQQQLLSPSSLQRLMELAGRDCKAREPAVWVLHNICTSRENIRRVMTAGLLPVLLSTLTMGSDLAREGAARLVSNIASHSEELAVLAAEAGVLVPLMDILSGGGKHSRKAAVMAVCQLALWEGNQDVLARTAGVELVDQLAGLLSSSDTAQQALAASALQNIAACSALRAVLLESEAVVALVGVLSCPPSMTVADAAGALLNMLAPGPEGSDTEQRADSHQGASGSESEEKTFQRSPASPPESSANAIVEAFACQPLISLLMADFYEVREVAAQLLYRLTKILPQPTISAILEADGLAAVAHLMGRWYPDHPEVAAELGALLLAAMPAQALGRAEDAVAPLTCMLQSREPPCLQAACLAIAAVAQHCRLGRAAVVSSGRVIPRIGAVLSMPDSCQVPAAVSALAVIATESNAARLAIARYCLEPLLDVVANGDDGMARDAAATLAELACNRSLRKRLLDAGALEALQDDGDSELSAVAGLAAARLTSDLSGSCAGTTAGIATWTEAEKEGEDSTVSLELQGRQSLLSLMSPAKRRPSAPGLVATLSRKSCAVVLGMAKGVFSLGRRRQKALGEHAH